MVREGFLALSVCCPGYKKRANRCFWIERFEAANGKTGDELVVDV